MHLALLLSTLTLAVVGCAAAPRDVSGRDPRREVWEAEVAFAATLAARDHEAFSAFLSEDAIFFSGSEALRGKAAVAEAWREYFDGPEAPFSWEPDAVEVLGSGDLALSTGPVRGTEDELVGRFNSIWRLERGVWRVVFDRGS